MESRALIALALAGIAGRTVTKGGGSVFGWALTDYADTYFTDYEFESVWRAAPRTFLARRVGDERFVILRAATSV